MKPVWMLPGAVAAWLGVVNPAWAGPACSDTGVFNQIKSIFNDEMERLGESYRLMRLSKIREEAEFPNPGGRYILYRVCAAEGEVPGRPPVLVRFVIQEKDWGWIFGYGMTHCVAGFGGIYAFHGAACEGLAPEAVRASIPQFPK